MGQLIEKVKHLYFLNVSFYVSSQTKLHTKMFYNTQNKLAFASYNSVFFMICYLIPDIVLLYIGLYQRLDRYIVKKFVSDQTNVNF